MLSELPPRSSVFSPRRSPALEEVVVRGPQGVTIHPHHNWLRSATTKTNPLRLGAA